MVLAGMIVRTIVFSRRNPISVILGRGGRARARRSEDQTLPTPFCTAAPAPEDPVFPRFLGPNLVTPSWSRNNGGAACD